MNDWELTEQTLQACREICGYKPLDSISIIKSLNDPSNPQSFKEEAMAALTDPILGASDAYKRDRENIGMHKYAQRSWLK